MHFWPKTCSFHRLQSVGCFLDAAALANAASFAGGILQSFADGTDEWRYQVGYAGLNGLIAAQLAADGSVSSSIRYPAPVVAAVFDEDVEPRSPGPYNLPVPSPPASPASFRSVAPRRDPHVDSYVFSCGHRFTGERMAATTTALRGRMKDAGMPLVGELLAADYALDRCAVACPGCVSRAVSTLAAAKI